MDCPHCGSRTPNNAHFCPTCGKPTDSHIRPGHSAETLLLAAIGPGAEHYLPIFLAREQGCRGTIGWHWPAFFTTFFWMLFRKMYGLAFAYLAIAVVLAQLAAPLLVINLGTAGAVLATLIYLGLAVLPALYAGSLYHRHCRKVIAFTQRYQPEPQRQLRQIELSGGTSGVAVPLIVLLASVPLIGVVAAIAMPAYQEYTTRSVTTAAHTQLRAAAASLDGYYQLHGRLPASLADAGVAPGQATQGLPLELHPDGMLSVTLVQPRAVAGKALQLQPMLNDRGERAWRCSSPDIQDRLLPMACRSGNE